MSEEYWGLHLNRTMCDVLDEMRKLSGTKNYGPLDSLIEEVQSMGNRMEAKLNDYSSLSAALSTRDELKREIISLMNDKKKLEGEVKDDQK